ncbi:MAG TPA: hypothetical protein VFF94_05295 [Novosphingobium sp.]|nr:hypothetical protein [Novosphingobium sp.]
MVETFIYLTAAVAIGVFVGVGLLCLLACALGWLGVLHTGPVSRHAPLCRRDSFKAHQSDYLHD